MRRRAKLREDVTGRGAGIGRRGAAVGAACQEGVGWQGSVRRNGRNGITVGLVGLGPPPPRMPSRPRTSPRRRPSRPGPKSPGGRSSRSLKSSVRVSVPGKWGYSSRSVACPRSSVSPRLGSSLQQHSRSPQGVTLTPRSTTQPHSAHLIFTAVSFLHPENPQEPTGGAHGLAVCLPAHHALRVDAWAT